MREGPKAQSCGNISYLQVPGSPSWAACSRGFCCRCCITCAVGFGETALQSLPGNVGDHDVADCMASLDAAAKTGQWPAFVKAAYGSAAQTTSNSRTGKCSGKKVTQISPQQLWSPGMTTAPSRIIISAVARPIPFAAAVIRATLFLNRIVSPVHRAFPSDDLSLEYSILCQNVPFRTIML